MKTTIAKIVTPQDSDKINKFESEFPLTIRMPNITKNNSKFGSGTRIFTAGSCFADNIAQSLVQKNYNVGPYYNNKQFRDYLGPAKDWMFCTLPENNPNIVSYTHTAFDPLQLNQDIKIALELLKGKKLPSLPIHYGESPINKKLGYEVNWFTPLMAKCWAKERKTIDVMHKQIYSGIARSLSQSNVYILTYGVAEYIKLDTGFYACNTGLKKLSSLRIAQPGILGVEEATRAITETIHNINKINKNGVIFISLSPVRLNYTISKSEDLGNIYQMGYLGKSILRVAIENAITKEILSGNQNVFYIPSYEFVSLNGAYESDQRHVSKEAVDEIIHCFTKSYFD